MRLVSLNAWAGQVWPAFSAWVPTIGADILCLQEVTRAPVPSPDWLVYADAERRLDQRTDLFADVTRLLPVGYQGQFNPANRGPLFAPDGKAYPSEFGLAMWVARPLAITECLHRFVFGTYRHDGWGAPPVPRNIQVMRLCDPATQRAFIVAHLHGLRDPAGKGDTPDRAAQAQAVLAALAAVRQPGDPVILAGDLNLLPDSATFAALATIGLTDLVTTRGHTDTRTTLYRKPQRHADYLLVTEDVHIIDFSVPAMPEVSDHRPMILDFALTT
jgi:endonuclease/exonuclease/phosphatase family metal-dependent hydrolase